MIVYFVIMVVMGLLFLGVGASIFRGNTKLIHDYHRRRIRESDRPAYAKAFGRVLFVLCGTFLLSGLIALLGESKGVVAASLAVLFAGLILAVVLLSRVQRKYNGGVF